MFLLELYQKNGWLEYSHILSTTVETKGVNFCNDYTNVYGLKAAEEASLFQPRFIIGVIKKIECNTDLDVNIVITLCDGYEVKASVEFKLFCSLPSGITV